LEDTVTDPTDTDVVAVAVAHDVSEVRDACCLSGGIGSS